jgi:hypothetical protein
MEEKCGPVLNKDASLDGQQYVARFRRSTDIELADLCDLFAYRQALPLVQGQDRAHGRGRQGEGFEARRA